MVSGWWQEGVWCNRISSGDLTTTDRLPVAEIGGEIIMAKQKASSKVHVRKGDTVLVITGKSVGKKGKVLSVIPAESRVTVEGVNVVKRHAKPTRRLPQGGIMEKEAPIHSSNVMLFCNKCNTPTKIGKRLLDGGEKVRICKKCGEVI